MFGLLKQKPRPEELQATELYNMIVSAARTPYFYADLSVPDSVDGRFEMISLHATLCICGLEELKTPEATKLSQSLFDQMFLDMDRSLREMGISDLSIPKHMKRMFQGFNGRAQAYKKALQNNNEADLNEALRRNVYGTVKDIDDITLNKMNDFLRAQWAHIKTLSIENFQNPQNIFIK